MLPRALLSLRWLWDRVPGFIMYDSGVTAFSRFTELFLFLHRPFHLLAGEIRISKKAYSKSLILLANFSLHLWDLTNWIYVFTADSYNGVRYIWPFCPMLHSHAEQEETPGKAQQRGLECQGVSPANTSMTAPGFTHPAQLSLLPALPPLPLWSYRKLCICSLCRLKTEALSSGQ